MSNDWKVFRGDKALDELPPAPPWRDFKSHRRKTGHNFLIDDTVTELVNAAIYLRRPLLITGPPGTGKSSLAYTVAQELGLGEVLAWPINSRSVLKDALYRYDPIERLRFKQAEQAQAHPISQYLRLGPLGTAFATSRPHRPRVLLIDEIDKSDIDLPNDLLHIFEDGRFEIPEITRLGQTSVEILDHTGQLVPLDSGQLICEEFPIVFITSNGERELPSPFLRRCLSLPIRPPSAERLLQIAEGHLRELAHMDDETIQTAKATIRQLADAIVA